MLARPLNKQKTCINWKTGATNIPPSPAVLAIKAYTGHHKKTYHGCWSFRSAPPHGKKQVAPAARPTPGPQKVEFLDCPVDFHLRSAARIFILARYTYYICKHSKIF